MSGTTNWSRRRPNGVPRHLSGLGAADREASFALSEGLSGLRRGTAEARRDPVQALALPGAARGLCVAPDGGSRVLSKHLVEGPAGRRKLSGASDRGLEGHVVAPCERVG